MESEGTWHLSFQRPNMSESLHLQAQQAPKQTTQSKMILITKEFDVSTVSCTYRIISDVTR